MNDREAQEEQQQYEESIDAVLRDRDRTADELRKLQYVMASTVELVAELQRDRGWLHGILNSIAAIVTSSNDVAFKMAAIVSLLEHHGILEKLGNG